MTPEYASPEQVQGLPVTTLTDVYSLGVVLYELLTGRRPYRLRTRSAEEVAQLVSTAEPERPSAAIARTLAPSEGAEGEPTAESVSQPREGTPERLRRRLRGDLDNIALLALRKEPARRYRSVEQLCEDIRRHLVGLPVSARQETFGYRAGKFVRRNRAAVGGAALVLLTLAGGVVTTAWQARRAGVQERLAKVAQARAERRFDDVRKLARSVLFDYHDAIKDLPGSTPVRERLVKDALEYLDTLASEESSDRLLQRELASAYEKVGDVQGGTMGANLGDTGGALQSYRKALGLREALFEADPGGATERREIAASRRKLGQLLWETGDMAGAAEQNRLAIELLDSLAASDPTNQELRHDLAAALDVAGMISLDAGEVALSLRHHRRAVALYDSLDSPLRESPKIRRGRSAAHEHLGSALVETGDLPQALIENRTALAMREALATEDTLNADYQRTLGVSHYNDGDILSRMGRYREALRAFRKGAAMAERLMALDPRNEQDRGGLSYALLRIGDALGRLGDDTQALPNYRRSRVLRAADAEADPINLWKRAALIEAEARIGKALAKLGRSNEALPVCAQALHLMQSTKLEADNLTIRGSFAGNYTELGEAYMTLATDSEAAEDSRPAHWRSARDAFRHSFDFWRELRSRGLLSAIDAGKPEAAARQIARCDAALGTRPTSRP